MRTIAENGFVLGPKTSRSAPNSSSNWLGAGMLLWVVKSIHLLGKLFFGGFRQFSNAYYPECKEWVSCRQWTIIADVALEIDDDRVFSLHEEADYKEIYLTTSFCSLPLTFTGPEQNGGVWKDLKIKAPAWVLPIAYTKQRKVIGFWNWSWKCREKEHSSFLNIFSIFSNIENSIEQENVLVCCVGKEHCCLGVSYFGK